MSDEEKARYFAANADPNTFAYMFKKGAIAHLDESEQRKLAAQSLTTSAELSDSQTSENARFRA